MIIKFSQKDQWHSLENIIPDVTKSLRTIVGNLNENRFGPYVFKKSKTIYYLKAKEKIVVEIIICKKEENPYIQLYFNNGMETICVDNLDDFHNALMIWYEEFIKYPTVKIKGYIRKGIYSIEDVLSKRNFLNSSEDSVDFQGDLIHMNSDRYHTFAEKGLKCVECGIEGIYFAKERDRHGSSRWHFNLYAVDNVTGEEVLMTKDHIIPKSKGGENNLSNYQTMCCKCNVKKGDTL